MCRERCRNWDRLTHATQDNRTRYENAFPGFVSCAESRIAYPAADRRELYKKRGKEGLSYLRYNLLDNCFQI